MATKTTRPHHEPLQLPELDDIAELEPEITAQPKPLGDDIVAAASDEGGLSVDPDDLGSQFLREAVQQGDPVGRDVAELELALREDSEAADRPSTEIATWSKMVEMAVRGGGASDPLREAAAVGAERLDAERTEAPEPPAAHDLTLLDSSIRDVSLLDHEGASLDEFIAPTIDLEDTGRHARTTSREALGEQVRGPSEPPATPKKKRGKLERAASGKLRKAAGKLRRVAKQLAHASHR